MDNFDWECTYCPEDNKLRLYYGGIGRFTDEDKNAIKSAGYRWASKQECYVAPMWTPTAEDMGLQMAGYIGDEDYGPQERAADRAERFEMYRGKRAAEAHEHADEYDAGPAAVGYQSQKRADRAAKRIERSGTKAVTQWEKAEYWQHRTAGVIDNAEYKSNPRVRRRRILKLEASQRRTQPGGRWHTHYTNRIAYERQMIGDLAGGFFTDHNVEIGGIIRGGHIITRIYKSQATGKAVSVNVIGQASRYNVQQLAYADYEPPTDDTRKQVADAKTTAKAEAKAKRDSEPPKPKLLNPTEADAQKLQDIWNAKEAARHAEHGYAGSKPPTPAQIMLMTQAQYSDRSKGSYSPCNTVGVTASGLEYHRRCNSKPTIFKVRQASSGGFSNYSAYRVVVITDKKQHPLPWDTMAEQLATAE